jgi:hypothetical protein
MLNFWSFNKQASTMMLRSYWAIDTSSGSPILRCISGLAVRRVKLELQSGKLVDEHTQV